MTQERVLTLEHVATTVLPADPSVRLIGREDLERHINEARQGHAAAQRLAKPCRDFANSASGPYRTVDRTAGIGQRAGHPGKSLPP